MADTVIVILVCAGVFAFITIYIIIKSVEGLGAMAYRAF